jgi:hypothetical protein
MSDVRQGEAALVFLFHARFDGQPADAVQRVREGEEAAPFRMQDAR